MSAAIETQFVTSLGKVNAVITAIDHVCIYSEKDRPIHYRKRLFDIRLHLYHDGIAWNQARHTPSIDAQDIGKPFLDNNATNHQKTQITAELVKAWHSYIDEFPQIIQEVKDKRRKYDIEALRADRDRLVIELQNAQLALEHAEKN